MKYAGLIENDIVDCDDGICVSLWLSGCSHKCRGCHNKELWDYNYGEEISREELLIKIEDYLIKNNIKRNFSILGGEPLDPKNIENTTYFCKKIKEDINTKIYIWTGYLYEDIKDLEIFNYIDVLIDGPYVESLRNLDLRLRGSSNQRILRKEDNWRII